MLSMPEVLLSKELNITEFDIVTGARPTDYYWFVSAQIRLFFLWLIHTAPFLVLKLCRNIWQSIKNFISVFIIGQMQVLMAVY